MQTLRAVLPLPLLLAPACHTDEDLFGPLPVPEPHVTARIDGNGFAALISIHLGDITGAGRYVMRPNEPQSSQRAALYIPGDPARLQYSALAGRFYFNAIRAVGTTGPEWIRVTEGSFRGTLAAWGSQGCF